MADGTIVKFRVVLDNSDLDASAKKSVETAAKIGPAIQASMGQAVAATGDFIESQEQASARIKDVVANSVALQRAQTANTEASARAAAQQRSYGQSVTVSTAAHNAGVRAYNDLTASAGQYITSLSALNTMMGTEAKTIDEITSRRTAYSKALSEGIILESEYSDALKLLDKQEQQVAKSQDAATASLTKLLAKYDPATTALERIIADEKKLADARASGAVSEERYLKATSGLATQRQEWENVANGVKNTSHAMEGLSLTSSGAMREYGLLLKNLATGETARAEQNIATLANRTGAFAAALRFVASPLGLVVVALVALGAAMLAASSEEGKLNQALIQTGNYAGTTVSQLQAMGTEIGASTGKIGPAREALALFASQGRITGDSLKQAAEAAVNFSVTTGKSIEDSVKEITKFRDEPAKAVAELNSQYHFLTVSTYEQIRALQEQGQKTAAAELAEKSLGDAMATRAEKVEANLGYLQRSWVMLGDAAHKAWDYMMGIGRDDSLAVLLEKKKKELGDVSAQLSQLLAAPNKESTLGMLFEVSPEHYNEKLKETQALYADLKTQIANLSEQDKAAGEQSAKDGIAQELESNAVASAAALDALQGRIDNNKKAQLELNKAAQDYYNIYLAGGQEALDKQTGIKGGVSFGKGEVSDAPAGPYWDTLKKKILEHTDAVKEANAAEKLLQAQMKTWPEQLQKDATATQNADNMLEDLAAGLRGPVASALNEHQNSLKRIQAIQDEWTKWGPINEEQQAKLNKLRTEENTISEKHLELAKKQEDYAGRALKDLDDQIKLLQLGTKARETETIVQKAQNEAIAAGHPLNEQELQDLRNKVASRQQVIDNLNILNGATETFRGYQMEAINSVSTAWGQFIVNGAHDFGTFGKSLVASAKNFVAQIIAEFARLALVKLFTGQGGGIGDIFTSLLGSLGGSAAGSAAGGGGGGLLGNLVSLFSGGHSLLGLFGGTSAFAGSTAAVSAGGTTAVGAGASAVGSVAMWIPIVGAIVMGMMADAKFFGQGWKASNGFDHGAMNSNPIGLASYPVIWTDKILQGLGMSEKLASIISGSSIISRLFGYQSPKVQSIDTNYTFGGEDPGGSNTLNIKQKGGIFSHSKYYSQQQELSDDQLAAITQMWNDIHRVMVEGAHTLGASVATMIDAGLTIHNDYDSKGKVTATKYIVSMLGKTWEEATQEAAQQRLGAEALIKQISSTSVGADASSIAEQWRKDAAKLAEGAQVMLQATKDLQDGFTLVTTGGLQATIALVQKLSETGESLTDAYTRIMGGTQLLDQALKYMGQTLDGTREDVVKFAGDIVTAAGSLEKAQTLWNNYFEGFYSEQELTTKKLSDLWDTSNKDLSKIGLDPTTSMADFRTKFEAMLPTLTPEQVVQWLEAGNALYTATSAQSDYTKQLMETAAKIADAQQQMRNMVDDLNAELSGSSYVQAISGIRQWEKQTVDSMNATARAAGEESASEQQLGLVHLVAAARVKAAAAQLLAETKSLIDKLYGSGVEQKIQNISEASNTMYASQLQGIKSIQDYLDSEILGDLSHLSPEDKLAEAKRQLQATQAAALGGDVNAINKLPQLADAFLRLERQYNTSGEDYNSQELWVRGLLQQVVGVVGPTATTGSASQSQFSQDLASHDAAVAASEAANRAELATQLAQHLRDLAGAVNEPVLQLAKDLGVSMTKLASDLGIDLSHITGTTVTQLANMATSLGVHLGDLTTGLGLHLGDLSAGILELTTNLGIDMNNITGAQVQSLAHLAGDLGLSLGQIVTATGHNLTDIAGGIRELATNLGIDLGNISATTVTQLAGLATTLGTNLTTLGQSLGVDLGTLASSQSAINIALGQQIQALPEDQRVKLQPYFDAIKNATTDADANTAVSNLEDATKDLPPQFRDLLAPYFDDMWPSSATDQFDYLSGIYAYADQQTQYLADIKQLLGGGYTPPTDPGVTPGSGSNSPPGTGTGAGSGNPFGSQSGTGTGSPPVGSTGGGTGVGNPNPGSGTTNPGNGTGNPGTGTGNGGNGNGGHTPGGGVLGNLFNGVPSFAVGSAGLPYDMLANVHAGEMIIDPDTSSRLRRYGIPVDIRKGGTQTSDGGAMVVAELKKLETEISDLKSAQKTGFDRVVAAIQNSAVREKTEMANAFTKLANNILSVTRGKN